MAHTNGQPPAQLWQCQHRSIFTPDRRLTSAAKRVSVRLKSMTSFTVDSVFIFMSFVLADRSRLALDLSQKAPVFDIRRCYVHITEIIVFSFKPHCYDRKRA